MKKQLLVISGALAFILCTSFETLPVEIHKTSPLAIGVVLVNVNPNPVSIATEIHYTTVLSGPVLIKVFSASGQELMTLVDEKQSAGDHLLKWNPKNPDDVILMPGLYTVMVQCNNNFARQTITVID